MPNVTVSTHTTIGSRKLTWTQKVEIAQRYANKRYSGETSQAIADAYGICRHYVPKIARAVAEDQEDAAPGSAKHGG